MFIQAASYCFPDFEFLVRTSSFAMLLQRCPGNYYTSQLPGPLFFLTTRGTTTTTQLPQLQSNVISCIKDHLQSYFAQETCSNTSIQVAPCALASPLNTSPAGPPAGGGLWAEWGLKGQARCQREQLLRDGTALVGRDISQKSCLRFQQHMAAGPGHAAWCRKWNL